MGLNFSRAAHTAWPHVWSSRVVTAPPAITPVCGSPTSSSRQGKRMTATAASIRTHTRARARAWGLP